MESSISRRLPWSGTTRAMILMLLLAVLMSLDVWLSRDVLAGTSEYYLEANPLAFGLGVGPVLALKLVFAGILGAYSVWRRSLKGLVVANVLMGLVIVWNVTMLVVF